MCKPSIKLFGKERVGSPVRRRYDTLRTPLEPVLACPEIAPCVAEALRRQRDRLDPFALARAIDQQLERIYALANSRHSPPASTTVLAPVPVTRRVRRRLRSKPAAALPRPSSSSVTSQGAR